jgi:uncharacterized protein YlxW (UPF0749 family)
MNLWEFLLGVVLVTGIVSIVRARYGIRRDGKGNEYSVRDDAETERLRDEVKTLKERLAVIERITVEKENSLEREIEALRRQ